MKTMKKYSIITVTGLLMVAFSFPATASAATSPGVKPGSFFYLFDTAFEKVGLFFTFNPERKARKALEHADERLAEIEAIAEEKNPDAVKTALTDYEDNVALATEKSKEVKDKIQAENLFTSIEDTTAKNQEALSAVLIKVPEEAKEAIEKAIEASKKGQEEAAKQMTELKKEVSELKQELEALKAELKDKEEVPQEGDDTKDEQTKTINKLKDEIENLKQKVSEPKREEIKQEKLQPLLTPSGAKIDEKGNILNREELEAKIIEKSAKSEAEFRAKNLEQAKKDAEASKIKMDNYNAKIQADKIEQINNQIGEISNKLFDLTSEDNQLSAKLVRLGSGATASDIMTINTRKTDIRIEKEELEVNLHRLELDLRMTK